jgi:Cu(I)/Ag(I) efflux system membrane fusion protein
MQKTIIAVAAVALIAASYGLGRYRQQSQAAAPIPDSSAVAPASVALDASAQRLSGVRLVAAERSGASTSIRAVGRVAPEDNRIYRVNCGVDGIIRETFGDPVGALVHKDQKLATFYAPDFLGASSGLLAALQGIPGSVGKDGARFTPNFPGAIAKNGVRSLQGYTDHLRDLGMSEVQIKQVADSRQLPGDIDVVSPVDGFILARSISPGQHFERLMEFYRIADLSRVWVEAEVNEQDVRYLHSGAPAQVALRESGRRLPARITDTLPQSEAGGGTVKLRLEVDNPAFLLRPEMLVDVVLPVSLPPSVTVPLSALVDSGAHTRVYVARGEGPFEPREVKTGWRFGERVEILQGVQPGERVVAAAAFLLDSESRLAAPASTSSPVSRLSGQPAHRTF